VATIKAVMRKAPHRLPRGGGKPNLIRLLVFILHIVFCKDTTFSERRRETMFHKQENMFNPAVFFDDETFFLLSET
jgi:hypothetical protein